MTKKVLIISSSLRKGGNSETLCDAFQKGAEEAGCQAEKVSLAGKQLAFCQGCLSCQETRHCLLHDDAEAITAEMKASDVIVFASPVYYYGLTGQLKTLLDRANPLFASDYKFRDIYFLASAAEEGAKTPSRSITSLEGWIECFPKAHLTGTVFAGGVTRVGDIKGHPALKKAYDMGRSLGE